MAVAEPVALTCSYWKAYVLVGILFLKIPYVLISWNFNGLWAGWVESVKVRISSRI